MNIAVIGLGYVGLPLALVLAQEHQVFGVDHDFGRIENLKLKHSYLAEPAIQELLDETTNLHLYCNYEEINDFVDYVFIALPTDGILDKDLDTHIITNIVNDIHAINPDTPIVIKSTVPIGYSAMLASGSSNPIIFCPEFTREGHGIEDTYHADRIILAPKNKYTERLADIINFANAPVFFMDYNEAEAVKLFSNTYLAMRVAFFNDIDTFCLQHDLNTKDLIDGVCADHRIGNHYNNPSFGYGGYCLPKDSAYIAAQFYTNALCKYLPKNNEDRLITCFCAFRRFSKTQHGDKIVIYRQGGLRWESRYHDLACQLGRDLEIDGRYKVNYYFEGDDLQKFKQENDWIITDRMSDELNDVKDKVFTRDLQGPNVN